MKDYFFCVLLLAAILAPSLQSCNCDDEYSEYHYQREPNSVYNFTVVDLSGKPVPLSRYRGFVLMIVNIAIGRFSQKQIKHMNILQEKYYDQGFRILAFPCDQFKGEIPKNGLAMKKFKERFGLKFEVFCPVKVNNFFGTRASPLYNYLKKNLGGYVFDFIEWDFTKFLVDSYGKPIDRFSFWASNEDIEEILVPILTTTFVNSGT